MDFNTIIQAVQSLGFPIVCCGALFWKINQQDKAHKEEMDSIRQSLDNNTNILTKLYERLSAHE